LLRVFFICAAKYAPQKRRAPVSGRSAFEGENAIKGAMKDGVRRVIFIAEVKYHG
jgi:hypothetical protein